MNNFTNISKPDSSHTTASPIVTSLNSALQGVKLAVSGDNSNYSNSFQSAFQAISNQMSPHEEGTAEQLSGKDFPVDLSDVGFISEMAAETGHAVDTGTNTDQELLAVEDGLQILTLPSMNIQENNQPIRGLVSDDLINNTNQNIEIEQNIASSFIPLSQTSDVSKTGVNDVSESKVLNDLNSIKDTMHSPLLNKLKATPSSIAMTSQPVTDVFQESDLAQQGTLLETNLNKTDLSKTDLSKTEHVATNTVITDSDEVVSRGAYINNEAVGLKQTDEPKIQAIQSAGVRTVNAAQEIETLDVGTRLINDSQIAKQTIEREWSALKDGHHSVDEVMSNIKLNHVAQKSTGSLEQQLSKAGSTLIQLNNPQITAQDAIELNDNDLALTSKPVVSNQTENNLSIAATLTGMAPQLRNVLQEKPQKVSLNDSVSITLADNLPGVERNMMQKMDVLSVNEESRSLIPEKIQNFLSMLNQQQSVITSQASQVASLVQHTTKAVDITSDSLTAIQNPVINNVTNTSSFTLPQAEITEFFGRSAWPQAMGKQVVSMINQNIGSAEIKLNPAHLGPIEILIDLSEDQVSVSLSSRHAVVREAMDLALPRLREMLNENGFNLADADISNQSFSEQREQNSKNSEHATETSDNSNNHIINSVRSDSGSQSKTVSTGTVDYFV